MADRSILVRLGLNVDDFNRGARSAASSLEDVVKKADKSEQVAATGLGRMEQSARLQAQEWNQVGGHLLKVGGVITGVNAAVAVTGVRYNMLQQTSRAALSTMMGGAAAAAKQMDRLDAFARTSPFAKDTFIRAQQQMLAFGIESKKVVPYLNSIQNAVAAAGGSNADLAGIVTIMAKIQSSAKVTAVDLMQFGNYGIDAASLIGAAMGKTGAEIRASITSGTLDAGQALDALAVGMQQKFGGAAANVKETLAGAFDRVKAAWRDLSSDLMSPMVGVNGGGIFVTLLNQAADLMRMVQKLPEPVKQVGFALSTTGGFALLAAGGFMKLVPGMLETHRAMTTLGNSGVTVLSKMAASFASVPKHAGDAMTAIGSIPARMSSAYDQGLTLTSAFRAGLDGSWTSIKSGAKSAANAVAGAFGGWQNLGAAVAVAGITAAVMAFSEQAQRAEQRAQALADTFDEVTGAATQATRAALADELWKYDDAFKRIGTSSAEAINAIVGGSDALSVWAENAMGALGAAGSLTGFMEDEGIRTVLNLGAAMVDAAEKNRVIAESMDDGAASAESLAPGLDGVASSAQDAAAAEQEAAEAAQAQKDAYDSLLDALKAVDDYRAGKANAANDYLKTQRDMIQAQKDFAEALATNGVNFDNTTEAGGKNVAMFQELVSSYDAYVEAAIASGTAPEQAFAEARAGIVSFSDDMQMSAEEVLAWAEKLGFMTDQDYKLKMTAESNVEAEAERSKDALRGVPEETWTQISGETNAPEIVAVVNAALDEGIPAETITKIFAENDTQAAAAEAEQMVNDVKQRKAARIEAVNAANPDIAQAQKSMDGFKQKSPAAVRVDDQASGVLSSIRRGLDALTSKTVTITTEHRVVGSLAGGTGMVATKNAMGGAIHGAGTGTSDSIPALLSNGEHVLTAYEVARLGGQQSAYLMRSMIRSGLAKEALGLAGGGAVSHAALAPTPFAPSPVAVGGQQVVNNTYNLRVDADVSQLKRVRQVEELIGLFPQLEQLGGRI